MGEEASESETDRVNEIERTEVPLSMIEGINVGAKFYVTKPFQSEDLLAKVNKVLGERAGHRLG